MSLMVELDPNSLVTITPIVKEPDPANPSNLVVVNKGVPFEITLAQLATWVNAQSS